MMVARRRDLVLALYPFTRGIAFAMFESPLTPIDWGLKDIRGEHRNALAFEATQKLIDRLQPDILVLHDFSCIYSRRGERSNRLQRLIGSYAISQSIEVYVYPRRHIRECFKSVGAVTRYEIAQAIASQVPAFGHRLPPARKIWQSEDSRMGLFDAASLVMTYYHRDGDRPRESG